MEPVSLTLGATTAALVAKAADQATQRAVDGGAAALRRLVGWLRERFSSEESVEGTTALARVEDAPDSPSRLRELAEILECRAAVDPGFLSELEGLVKNVGAEGVDVGSIAQTAWGEQNVQNAGIVNSDVTVTYGQSPPSGQSGH